MAFYAYAKIAGEKEEGDWVLDSGADSHFIIKRDTFTTYMLWSMGSLSGVLLDQ